MMVKMTAFTDSEYTFLHELGLDGIKKRVENVTPGEWEVKHGAVITKHLDFQSVSDGVFGTHNAICYTNDGEYIENSNSTADAQFIAHARQDVPALIAEVERLRAALDAEKASTEWVSREAGMIRERLEAENDALREALRFYANELNHKSADECKCYNTHSVTAASVDKGELARCALKGERPSFTFRRCDQCGYTYQSTHRIGSAYGEYNKLGGEPDG